MYFFRHDSCESTNQISVCLQILRFHWLFVSVSCGRFMHDLCLVMSESNPNQTESVKVSHLTVVFLCDLARYQRLMTICYILDPVV